MTTDVLRMFCTYNDRWPDILHTNFTGRNGSYQQLTVFVLAILRPSRHINLLPTRKYILPTSNTRLYCTILLEEGLRKHLCVGIS